MNNTGSISFEEECRACEFFELMFKRTAPDGILHIDNWYDVFSEDLVGTNDFIAKIKWTREQYEDLLVKYNALVEKLKELSEYCDELYGRYDFEVTQKLLPKGFSIAANKIFMEPLQEDSLNVLELTFGRKGDELCGRYFIIHSQRLCRLFSLDAPNMIIENECKYVFASMAIYNYAESFEQIKNQR